MQRQEGSILSFSGMIYEDLLSALIKETVTRIWTAWNEYFDEMPSLNGRLIAEACHDASMRVILDDATVPREERPHLEAFLKSRDFVEFATDVTACVAQGFNAIDMVDVQRTTRQILKLHRVQQNLVPVLADRLIEAVSSTIAPSLASFNPLSASRRAKKNISSERRAAIEHQTKQQRTATLNRLSAIANLLDQDYLDIAQLEAKLDRLRTALIATTAMMSPPSLSGTPKVPMEALYVPPRLTRAKEAQHSFEDIFHLLDAQSRHLVILGTPGNGKSTLVSRFVNVLCSGKHIGVISTAFPLVLREQTSNYLGSNGFNIKGAVQETARNRFQTELTSAEADFILASGHCVLLIDGLDELPDLAARQVVIDSIEAFCATSPRTPVIVTSRLVGYIEAGLSPSLFTRLDLTPFDKNQISDYCHRWFSIAGYSARQANELMRSFLAESEDIPDLRENPLLLSLLCSLYRRQEHLPQNRPDVYASCATMLFDTWDRRKRLRPAFSFEAHIMGAVQHLAYWMFTKDIEGGVPEGEFIDKAAEYFEKWQFGSDHGAEARLAAHEFITFCRGRAWILTDVGTDPADIPLYNFTHRTFCEYFTAVYIVQNSSTEHLPALVSREAHAAKWDVVCQIIVSLAATKQRGLEDEIVAGLCDITAALGPSTPETHQKLMIIGLCLSILRAVPLRPSTVERVCLEALNFHTPRAVSGSPQIEAPERDSTWVGYRPITPANRSTADRVVAEFLTGKLIRTTDRNDRQVALAYLADFFIRDDRTPVDLLDVLPAETHDLISLDIRAAAVDAVRAALNVCGMAFGVPSVRLPLPFTRRWVLVGSNADRISPVQSLWGGRLLPNALDLTVWHSTFLCARNASQVRLLASFISAHWEEILRFAQCGFYEPHPVWWAEMPHSHLRDIVHVDSLEPEFRRPLAYLAALLSEVWVATPRDPEELKRKHWGALTSVGQAAASRFGLLSQPLSIQDTEAITSLGLMPWARGLTEIASLARF
jgi:hypothetical protein